MDHYNQKGVQLLHHSHSQVQQIQPLTRQPQNMFMSQKQQYHAPTSGQNVFGAPKTHYSIVFCGVEIHYHLKYIHYFPAHNILPQCTIIYRMLQQNVS
jgi:hypothetical protein